MSAHRHRWEHSAWQGDNLIFRCQDKECRAEFKRKMTHEEKGFSREYYDFFDRRKPTIHTVYHDFTKRFCDGRNKWKWTAGELMDKVESWAKKYPDDVRVVSCDDDHHASSILVCIEHQTENDYHGTTVVYIPQCTGEDPTRFFLYPGHRAGVLRALTEITKKSRPIQRRAVQAKTARDKAWKKLVTLPPSDAKPTSEP